jgi:cob(I)alamin adenosyltransferase
VKLANSERSARLFTPPRLIIMSIATKTGDAGTTALMFGRRVSKADPRVIAYGTIDELNAALGMVRATVQHPLVSDAIFAIQKDLVILMGELAVAEEDR